MSKRIEYEVSYLSNGSENIFVGSAYGIDENDAIDEFMIFHANECKKILSIKKYK